MKEYLIGPNDAGQRLDRFLRKAEPSCPASAIQKSLRTRHVKIDGRTAKGDARLAEGQRVSWRAPAAYLDTPPLRAVPILSGSLPLSVVYEDEDILLIDKPAGLSVQPDAHGSSDTLIARIWRYLHDTGAYRPEKENSFAPALVHRLDRNTAGLVLAAKNAEALRILSEKMRAREIDKYYLCVVLGRPDPPEGLLKDTLLRDTEKKQVFRVSPGAPGGRTALTAYRVLRSTRGLSLVECHLLTGRTHQIRAQMAGAGHPLLGDGKYGDYALNRQWGKKHQALLAYKMVFSFVGPAGRLDHLNGRVFEVETSAFETGFFGS